MGTDKATLAWGSTTLAERAAAVLASVVEPVLEVGPGRSGLVVVREDPPGRGPLAALAAGWAALTGAAAGRPGLGGRLLGGPGGADDDPPQGVVVLACDLPLVGVPLLAWLADHPAPGSVVPLAGDPAQPQPLCARWADHDLAALDRFLAAGVRSLRPLVARPGVVRAPAEDWLAFAGPAGRRAFDDADTPAQLRDLADLADLSGLPGPVGDPDRPADRPSAP